MTYITSVVNRPVTEYSRCQIEEANRAREAHNLLLQMREQAQGNMQILRQVQQQGRGRGYYY